MSDEQSLLLLLLVLYFSDCLFWIQRNAVLLEPLWGRVWSPILAGTYPGNDRGALRFINPLPPLNGCFVVSSPGISLSSEAVCSFTAQTLTSTGRAPQRAVLFEFDEIDTIETAANSIRINDTLFLTCRSDAEAIVTAQTIRQVREKQPKQRQRAIAKLTIEQFETTRISERFDEYWSTTRILRILATIMWGYLLLLTPLSISVLGFQRVALPLFLLFELLHVTTLIMFFRTHRRLLPEDRQNRIASLLKMLLCPPTAIRAVDEVSNSIMAGFHPLAVIRVLSSEIDFLRFARIVYLDCLYPLDPEGIPEQIRRAEETSRAVFRTALESFLEKEGVDFRSFVTPPEKVNSDDHAYCPRCAMTYAVPTDTCVDCVGVPLAEFGNDQRDASVMHT